MATQAIRGTEVRPRVGAGRAQAFDARPATFCGRLFLPEGIELHLPVPEPIRTPPERGHDRPGDANVIQEVLRSLSRWPRDGLARNAVARSLFSTTVACGDRGHEQGGVADSPIRRFDAMIAAVVRTRGARLAPGYVRDFVDCGRRTICTRHRRHWDWASSVPLPGSRIRHLGGAGWPANGQCPNPPGSEILFVADVGDGPFVLAVDRA